MKQNLQNVAIAATTIEVAVTAIRDLAGTNLSGSDMKDLEDIYAQELHAQVMEAANAQ